MKVPSEEVPRLVTRLEVIDDTGRRIVHYGQVTVQFQDDGQTVKCFVKGLLPIKNIYSDD